MRRGTMTWFEHIKEMDLRSMSHFLSYASEMQIRFGKMDDEDWYLLLTRDYGGESK